MALRFYLVPAVDDGTGTIVPAYLPRTRGMQTITYGNEGVYLAAIDLTLAEHTAVMTHPEVVSVAASNLDIPIGAGLATLQGQLDAFKIPNTWITALTPARVVLRNIWRLCYLCTRFEGLHHGAGKLFASGLTLASTVGEVPPLARQRVIDAAQQLGLDTSSLTLTMTLQVALRTLLQQIAVPAALSGVDL